MGQPVRVAEKISPTSPGTIRIETNRPLTGMGHRYYRSAADSLSEEDPADVLAARLFARGGIVYWHVHGNVATVDLAKGYTSEGIVDIIVGLFAHYET